MSAVKMYYGHVMAAQCYLLSQRVSRKGPFGVVYYVRHIGMYSTTFDEKAKLWYGRNVPPLYNPQDSLGQVLLNSMATFGNKIAQIDVESGYEMSFNELQTKTIRVAQNLQALGYKQNQIFGIMAKNSRHVAPITFASIAMGCPLDTLHSSFNKTDLIHRLKITKPVLMFCDKSYYTLLNCCLKEIDNDAKIFTFDGCIDDSVPVENLFQETFKEIEYQPATVDVENDTALIVCSSGTTGPPKAICLSHAALLSSHTRYNTMIGVNEKMFTFAPLQWISSLVILISGTISGSTRIITTAEFSPELQLYLIEKFKITHLSSVARYTAMMIKNDRFHKTDFSSIKSLISGSSIVSLHLKNAVQQALSNGYVYVGWGMSETAGRMICDFPATKKDTIGRIADGCCIKIIDDNGNRCGVNVEGELCVKMSYKFLGYFGNQEATNAIIDEEGFLKTRDIAWVDEDGDLHIIDRKEDLMKFGGCIVASFSAIDAFLLESSAIQSACIVRIPNPNGMGDLLAAAVIRVKGSNITEQDVFDMVADHFPYHSNLHGGVYFMETIPTTSTGKPIRRKVQEIVIELFNEQYMKRLNRENITLSLQ